MADINEEAFDTSAAMDVGIIHDDPAMCERVSAALDRGSQGQEQGYSGPSR